MIFNDPFVRLIGGPVGNNLANNERDVMVVKRSMTKIGRFEEEEPHGIITRELDDSIKNFQSDSDLKIDGLLFPGGETETALSEAIFLSDDSEEESEDDGENDGDEEDNGEDLPEENMPAVPPGDIEREVLPPPPEKERMIPGTNIPDRGIPEQGFPNSPNFDPYSSPRYRVDKGTDPGFVIPLPRDIDPGFERHPDSRLIPSGKRDI